MSNTEEMFDREMVVEFLEESLDQISDLENKLIEFEKNPNNLKLIDDVFRPVHSIKGTAGFFKLTGLQKLAHKLENVLDLLRKEEISPSPEVVSAELSGFEELHAMCQRLVDNDKEILDQDHYDQLIQHIEALSQQRRDSNTEVLLYLNAFKAFQSSLPETVLTSLSFKILSEHAEHLDILVQKSLEDIIPHFLAAFQQFQETLPSEIKSSPDLSLLKKETRRLESIAVAAKKGPAFRKTGDFFYLEMDVSGEISTIQEIANLSFDEALPINTAQRLNDALISLQAKVSDEALALTKEIQLSLVPILSGMEDFDTEFQNQLTISVKKLVSLMTRPAKEEKRESAAEQTEEKPEEKHEVKTMRVSEDEVDGFMHFVGELVVVSDMLKYIGIEISKMPGMQDLEENFKQAHQTFHALSRNLIDSLLKVRLIPVDNLLKKVPGLARSLADKVGKKVRVEIHGGDIKIDKSLHELMDHPLTHIIRNSLDHGLESPEEREAAGKEATGLIQLEVKHDGEWIHFKIQDDGAGIQVDRIKQKALEKELITPEQAASLPEEEAANLLFLPGFSTAKTVSDISGRGVGLDVVKKNIEEVNGQVSISSQAGQGTTFYIKLPSSTSFVIIEGVNTSVGQTEYIFPVECMQMAFQPQKGEVFMANDIEVVRHKDRILPVLRLYKVFKMNPDFETPEDSIFIIVDHQKQHFAVMVDKLLGKTQVVLKEINLGEQEGEHSQKDILGGAIMGHGNIALVLDIEQLKNHLK
ncbi:MAG: chemotaxis protein CheA [SAR324 cluster bacterium]|nr:chemotaxis protein CheA [SAR324 cluster bacterium]